MASRLVSDMKMLIHPAGPVYSIVLYLWQLLNHVNLLNARHELRCATVLLLYLHHKSQYAGV